MAVPASGRRLLRTWTASSTNLVSTQVPPLVVRRGTNQVLILRGIHRVSHRTSRLLLNSPHEPRTGLTAECHPFHQDEMTGRPGHHGRPILNGFPSVAVGEPYI